MNKFWCWVVGTVITVALGGATVSWAWQINAISDLGQRITRGETIEDFLREDLRDIKKDLDKIMGKLDALAESIHYLSVEDDPQSRTDTPVGGMTRIQENPNIGMGVRSTADVSPE